MSTLGLLVAFVVAFQVHILAIPSGDAKIYGQGEWYTSSDDVNATLNLLQIGLSVKAGNHPQNDGAMLCAIGKTTSDIRYSTTLCQDTTHYRDTLLVIHFNDKPRDGVLPFLSKRYSQCFRHILVVAPERPPDCPQLPFLHCDDSVKDHGHWGARGYFTQNCYAAAMVANPHFRSYFIMNDDSPFIPKRFMPYDRDRWWQMDCPPGRKLDPRSQEGLDIDFVFGSRGLQGLVSWWNEKATEQMKEQYVAYMKGVYAPTKCYQELLHIPKTMVPFYLQLVKDMPNEHLELFHAMVNHLWAAAGEQVEIIPARELFWDLDYRSGTRGTLATLENHTDAAMVHPLKLSDAKLWAAVDDWLFHASNRSR
jgi:hypothetical protein